MDGDLITMEAESRARDWRTRPLIVLDAVRFTRNLTLEMLRHAGATRLKGVDNPKAASFLLKETRDPVLIADWRSDFAAGPGLIRALRRGRTPARNAPALLLSDRRGVLEIEDARDAGISAMAVRPIPTQAFIDRLGEITARPRRFIETERFAGPDRRAVRPAGDQPDYKRGADVTAGRTTPLEAARAQARAIIFEKLRRNDPLAARVGKSLERYLSHLDAIEPRSAEIIQLHRATLGKLEDHRGADMTVRLDIVAGLERLVERRTAA
jgi:AmiR/NasT family two-component response regulator